MYPVSSKFLEAIRQTGWRKTVVDIYKGNSPSPLFTDIPVVSGTVTADRTSDTRRQGSIVVADASFITKVGEWGSELVIRTGVVYPNRTEELVPLGRFRIEDHKWSEGSEDAVTIEFFDRAKAMIDTVHLLDRDYSGKYGQAIIQSLVSYSFPNSPTGSPTVTFDPTLPNGNIKLPGGSTYSSSHFDTCKSIAEAMGGEIFFDVLGDVQVKRIPSVTPYTPTSSAVWTVDSGPIGVMVGADRSISRTDTYNGVIVYGANSSNNKSRVYGEAYDSSSGPTNYYWSQFGRKTLRVDNQALTTKEQCRLAATEKLIEVSALSKSVDFKSLRNPALDVGDIINVIFLDGSNELHVIDSLSIPIGQGDFSGVTRSTQFIS